MIATITAMIRLRREFWSAIGRTLGQTDPVRNPALQFLTTKVLFLFAENHEWREFHRSLVLLGPNSST
jgi:hypothetical protein